MWNFGHKKPSLGSAACQVLLAAEPTKKQSLSFSAVNSWKRGEFERPSVYSAPPRFPATERKPKLVNPKAIPRRKGQSLESRVALLHSIAHIEYTAINLAWDIIVRFQIPKWPMSFYDDWVKVAADETKHFQLISERLQQLGYSYGDLPAHQGLWNAALDTYYDPIARLVKVPLCLEARALDVTPGIIKRLKSAGDHISADIIEKIAADEIEHVKIGWRWFNWLCKKNDFEPKEKFETVAKDFINAPPKPPFNKDARSKAGLPSFLSE